MEQWAKDKNIWFVIDVEADGPCPGSDMYSMVKLGGVVLDRTLNNTFYAEFSPISPCYSLDALKACHLYREDTLKYPDPIHGMKDFENWVLKYTDGRRMRPVFISDNPGFDWQFVNYYCHRYLGHNPFGHTSRRIGDMYAGLVKNSFAGWKQLRKTKHTHNPVDDAKGNAEALLEMEKMGLRIPIVD